ncbi:MAG: hypothetical protein NC177_01915 [Ruminococcus flavefaciens]|nr:hypothetical protein [Ruminococcus flavefaciens]
MEIIFGTIIPCVLFVGIPVGIMIFFIVSLIRFKRTSKDSENYKKRKTTYIVSAVLAGILFTAVVALFIMISISLTYM